MSTKAKNPNKLSFILYEENNAPKYFEVKKSFLKFILVGLPIVALASLAVVAIGTVYFKQIKTMAERKEPKIIAELRTENETLKAKQEELVLLTKELENRLAAPASGDEVSGLASLSLFQAAQGQKDLTQKPLLTIENVRAELGKDNILFSFRLVNQTIDNNKLAGFVFVMMRVGETIYFYPADSIPENDMKLSFNRGEPFATSRFRPVEATFPKPAKSTQALFKILIFSRTGDLIHKKIISRNIEI